MTDWELLRAFANENAETAFRELVDRYSGMVYHAALRQTGHADQAEEVAQIVFIALARKAGRIPPRATLHGWLFRAIRFTVAQQARANASRQRREQEAVLMQTNSESDESESAWGQMKPILDDALEAISERDREIIMMRFFSSMSHKDMAEALGLSEETARKRLSRSIDRLRLVFKKRGIAAPSLALAAALAEEGSQAAPQGMAAAWATAALTNGAPGPAATLASGIPLFGSAARFPMFLSGLAALILIGGLLAVWSGVPKKTVVTPGAVNRLALAGSNSDLAPPIPGVPLAKDSTNSAASKSALDRIRAALRDSNPTRSYPNPVMQDAIAGIGEDKAPALPILEEGLNDSNAVVRLRAVDGLGIVGPQASGAAPRLLTLLRDGGFNEEIHEANYAVKGKPTVRYRDGVLVTNDTRSYPIYPENIILYSLGNSRPGPAVLAEFARMLKESKPARAIIYRAIGQFSGAVVRENLLDCGWLWEMVGENAKALNDAFRPLLGDSDSFVSQTAARALVRALGNQADPAIFPVAVAMLKPVGGQAQPNEVSAGLGLLRAAAVDPGPITADTTPESRTLYAPRLGPYLNEVVAALSAVARNDKSENRRLEASKMLDILVPDFRKAYPNPTAELDQEKEADAFFEQVLNRQATIPEIVAGMKKYPTSVRKVARFYLFNGSTNDAALRGPFADELAARAPATDAANADKQKALNDRAMLADAIQKIAPDRAKVIFTDSDVIALKRIWLRNEVLQSDADRREKISAALDSTIWSGSHKGLFDASPENVHQLLSALQQADAATHAAVLEKVKQIDPRFSEEGGGNQK